MTRIGHWLLRAGRAVPAIVTPRVMALTMGAFFVAGGLMGGVVAGLMSDTTEGNRAFVVALGTIGFMLGAGILIFAARVSRRSYNWLALTATGFVTMAIVLATDDRAAMALTSLYALIACDAAFLLPWRSAFIHTVVAATCGVAALATRDGMPWWSGLVSAGIAIAVLLVVGVLVRQAADADIDSLTGLLNRRGFDRALGAAIAEGHSPTIALFDLDGFRAINDEFGHRAGDGALQAVTDTWRTLLDSGDVLARYGGDEFALLLADSTEADAVRLADRMREAIPLDVCAGVTAWQTGESASFMVSRADVGLYRAKASSRNRTVLESASQLPVAEELCEALQREELGVHYQPIVRLPDGHLVGYEALIRWRSTLDSTISPVDVIAIAEEHGLIPALGRFVLRRACADATALQECTPDHPITLNVNVSGIELLEPGYVAGVEAVINETEWPADKLVLEVTETALDVETPTTIAKLAALRAKGIKIAIDDFGTGYSSLRRLVTLPTDLLKLDRSFVSSSLREPSAQLLKVIGQLGDRLGLPVIVEGVEDGNEADQLATMGFTLAQGYYYGRPEPLPRYTQTSGVVSSAAGESTA